MIVETFTQMIDERFTQMIIEKQDIHGSSVVAMLEAAQFMQNAVPTIRAPEMKLTQTEHGM